jgi:hypothetical protein
LGSDSQQHQPISAVKIEDNHATTEESKKSGATEEFTAEEKKIFEERKLFEGTNMNMWA